LRPFKGNLLKGRRPLLWLTVDVMYIYINTRSLKRDRAIKQDLNYIKPNPFEFDEDDALGLEDDLASILGKRKRSEDDETD
jgi:hypothetical protein